MKNATLLTVTTVLLLGALALTAAIKPWSGAGTDDNWSTAANWASGIPGASDEACFQNGGSTATLDVNPVILMSSISNGSFTINSPAGTTGTISFTGNVNPQRYIVQRAGDNTHSNSGDRIFNCRITLPAVSAAWCDRQLMMFEYATPNLKANNVGPENFIFNGDVILGARSLSGAGREWVDFQAYIGTEPPNCIFNGHIFSSNSLNRAFVFNAGMDVVFALNNSNYLNAGYFELRTQYDWKNGTLLVNHDHALDSSRNEFDINNDDGEPASPRILRAYLGKSGLTVKPNVMIRNGQYTYFGSAFEGGTSTWAGYVYLHTVDTITNALPVYFENVSNCVTRFDGPIRDYIEQPNLRPVVVRGLGTIIWSGLNRVMGAINVEPPMTLLVNSPDLGTNAFGYGNITVKTSVADPARLGGTGVIGNNFTSPTVVSIEDGSTLVPGASVGTLTLTNATLAFSPTAMLDVELGALSSGAFDRVSVFGDVTLDGIVNVTGLPDVEGGLYPILSYSGIATDNEMVLGTVSLPPGYLATLVHSNAVQQVFLDVVVPEPGLMGLAILAMLGVRRR